MKVRDYGESLEGILREIQPSPPEGTALHRVAREARGMADAYLHDGRTFLSSGDLMDALAAFTYASGWLDATTTLGLFTKKKTLGIPVFVEEALSMDTARLRGKTGRYRKMLSAALEALECSPDPGSPLFPAATLILERAGEILKGGDLHAREGKDADALACYSHGHGWLDAGVRAGLFRILHSRDLFTVGPL
jgi:hypothetical protein